jgi:predicted MPP superfamily phosphohydrolase
MLPYVNPISRDLFAVAVLLIFIASQLFWFSRARRFIERLTASKTNQRLLRLGLVIAYILLFAYNLPWGGRRSTPTHLTIRAALLNAPFQFWIVASLLAFLILVPFSLLDRVRGAVVRAYQKLTALPVPDSASLLSPSRRTFLQQTATVACGAPFVAGAYGLFYGRLNLETTHRRIRLARCPRAFEGFRIAQLSDIHIGPFMTAQEVSRYVEITNALKADLVTLTGDFITWDPATKESVVEALARLQAPFGIFGCLGNHEIYTRTEESITQLFAARGIRILRQQRAAILAQGATLNLIGVDFQPRLRPRSRGNVAARSYLRGIDPLIQPDTVNILLSHNPNSFDRAAELGIDLSLAGHTHGGQVNLEFVHPGLTPSRLITPYVKGWFEKNGAQLYVNRGIGTIGVPVRFGARPEITVFELTRES